MAAVSVCNVCLWRGVAMRAIAVTSGDAHRYTVKPGSEFGDEAALMRSYAMS